MVSVENSSMDPEQAAVLIRGQAEVVFTSLVKSSEDVKVLLGRIRSVGANIPRARGSIQVRSIDGWFESYRRQIVWNVPVFDTIIEENQSNLPASKERVSIELKPTITDINIELGLVELSLSDTPSARVNISKPLESTQRYITRLKLRLMNFAAEALETSVSQNFELVFHGADAERALNDDMGSVAFQEEHDLIEIAPGHDGERADLRAIVADALADISDPVLLNRVSQRNRKAADLIRSYVQRFEANSPEADILLYSSGVKISTSMDSLANPTYDDERPPQEFLDGLRTLIIHHEAYIWSVPRIREVIELRRRTLESYSANVVIRSSLQSELLDEIGKAEDMVGPRTRSAITDVNELLKEPVPVAVGPEAMQYGLLRGALQFMGRAIVQARKATIQVGQLAATKLAASVIVAGVTTSPLYPQIVQFFQAHAGKILHLASSAQDWSWLQYVFQIMKLS